MCNGVPLSIQNVSKSFRQKRKRRRAAGKGKTSGTVTAVSCVSMDLNKGEIYGLLGPNGCGKSTLVRIVATLLLPDEGSVSVFGRDVVQDAGTVRRLVHTNCGGRQVCKERLDWAGN